VVASPGAGGGNPPGTATTAIQSIDFRILGPVEARVGGQAIDLFGPRQQRLLAVLLLHADRVVPMDRIVDLVWDDEPPATARRQVQDLASRLRRTLQAAALPGSAAAVIVETAGDGYRLGSRGHRLDLRAFDDAVRDARELAEPDPDKAARLLRDALAMWRGPALAGLDGMRWRAVAAPIDERRLTAWEQCLALELGLERFDEVVDDATELVAQHPFREHLVELLMIALADSGRRAEALAAFSALRARLADELGLDPGPGILRRQREVLAGEPLEAVRRNRPRRPRQLPHDVDGFTGRAADLRQLDATLPAAPTTTRVVVVSGTAGVGKTTLALHWAHRVADRFPDGQLYANLRGYDPREPAMAWDEAVRSFLTALDVAPEQIPADRPAQAALYRSRMAGRRMLIVLDNARDGHHVEPLLPAAPGSLVLITSRDGLPELVAGVGARCVTLDLFSAAEARALLVTRLDPARVGAEPAAVDALVQGSGRLPIALAILAARAAAQPHLPLSALLDRARSHGDGHLDLLGVRAVFAASYDKLTDAAARLFRLLGIHPGVDITAAAAARLAGLPVRPVHRLLDELTRANLVTQHRPGRYVLHDLLQAYAGELAGEWETAAERRAAIGRLLDHYLHMAHYAAQTMSPGAPALDLPPAEAAAEPPDGAEQAVRWFTAERPVLLAAVQHAASEGFNVQAWQLAWSMADFLDRAGNWRDLAGVQQIALAAAHAAGDPRAEADSRRNLARAAVRFGRFDEATDHLLTARELYRAAGDDLGYINTFSNFIDVFGRQHRYEEALALAVQTLEMLEVTRGHDYIHLCTLNNVGWLLARLGEYSEAKAYVEQSVAGFHELGHAFGEANACETMGFIHIQQGDHAEAVRWLRHSLAAHRGLSSRRGEAMALSQLGDCHAALGDTDAARAAWESALAVLESLGQAGAPQVAAKLGALGQRSAEHPNALSWA
jgi:DNA-binding SARP family transcriptional activator/tetratricopeptide (TPR) repeat protein